MNKQFTSLMLVGLLLNLFLFSTARAHNSEKEAKYALKVKNEIVKLGTGIQSKIKIKLRDKSKINGYVSEISNENFTVINEKNNQPIKVSYVQVKKASGINHLNGKKILIGILIAWVILGFIVMVTSET